MKHEQNHDGHLPSKQPVPIREFKQHIGNLLRTKRLEKNYSIRAVADDTGHSKSSLGELENGTGHLNIETLAGLAAYYGVPLTDFFTPP